MTEIRRRVAVAAVAAGVALALAACAPGSGGTTTGASQGPVSKDVKGAGEVTLTVWDQNSQGGIATAQKQLNAAFEKKYPNVTIKRVSRSFADLKSTLKLALSGNNPPDVVQANQGYPDMGAFVKAKLLRPVDDYAKLYDWTSYYPESLLKQNSFSADGTTWQSGRLFGVSQTGEVVGIYYNRAKLDALGVKPPTTLAEFEDAMAAAKREGETPLTYGDLNKSPGIHLFGVTQAAIVGAPAIVSLVTGAKGSWTDPASKTAATTIAGWQKKGYLTPGANGISGDDAAADFGKGTGVFLLTGTWQQALLEGSLGAKNVGFTTLTAEKTGKPATTGGQGLAWAITSKSANPDVAAAYIDFVTNAGSAAVLLKTGNLPTVLPADYTPESGTLAADIATQYRDVAKADGVVPYLDYATPTFYDTLSAGVQDLVAGTKTPDQFLEALQRDYSAFEKQRG